LFVVLCIDFLLTAADNWIYPLSPRPWLGLGSLGKVLIMLRVGLIAYLMIASLAGPAWCCCTFTRLASFASTTGASDAPVPCCCHTNVPAQDGETSSNPEERKSSVPGEDRCPCKEHRAELQALPFLNLHDIRDARAYAADLDSVGTMADCTLCMQADLQSGASLLADQSVGATLTGRDILCAFQVFRC